MCCSPASSNSGPCAMLTERNWFGVPNGFNQLFKVTYSFAMAYQLQSSTETIKTDT